MKVKESFGGAFMIKLLLVFIVIYISFMAIAVNYAKTFRVKNNIINILEQNQYNSNNSASISTIRSKIEEYVQRVPYTIDINGQERTDLKQKCDGEYMNGVCISPQSNTGQKAYYKVTVYISLDLPFFEIHMTVPVSGETKTIYIS